jgi:hypothetical protein
MPTTTIRGLMLGFSISTRYPHFQRMKKDKSATVLQGTIKRHPDGFGFFIPEQIDHEDVYIPRHSMNGAMTNDKVKIKVDSQNKQQKSMNRYSGEILEITERSTKQILGRYHKANDRFGFIVDEGKGWGADLKIPLSAEKGAKDGEWVSALIKSYPESDEGFVGEVKEILGSPYFVLFVWLGVAFMGLGNYKQEIYDHYYGFFFAAPFLLLGGLIEEAFRSNKKWRTLFVSTSIIGILALTYINIKNTPLQYSPNRQLQRSVALADKIMVEGNGEPLNFAVIAERNYEGAYQYFLEKENYPVKKIDPLDTANTITEQLFVVCELPKEKCDPTHNPKSEVANFGWSKIDTEWDLEGVTLYKLIHTEQ